MQWRSRYEDLKHALGGLGLLCPGSVVERYMPCGKSACHCMSDPANRHGPYYEWSRKVRGKTVTVRLTQQEANLYQEFTRNDRAFRKLVDQMRKTSLLIAKVMAAELKMG